MFERVQTLLAAKTAFHTRITISENKPVPTKLAELIAMIVTLIDGEHVGEGENAKDDPTVTKVEVKPRQTRK